MPVREVTVVDLWTDANRGDNALQLALVGMLRRRYPDAVITGVFRFGTNEIAVAGPEIRSTTTALDRVHGGIRRTYYAEANAGRLGAVSHQVVSLFSFVEALVCTLLFRGLGRMARPFIGSPRCQSLAAVRDADIVVWKGKNFRSYPGRTAISRTMTLCGAGWFAGLLRARTHCVNASFWPIRNPLQRWLYRMAFRRCASVTVRDPSSAVNASELLGPRVAVTHHPDLSFDLLRDPPALPGFDRSSPRRDVALTITAWGDAHAQSQYADALFLAATRLHDRGATRFTIVPQVTRQAEDNSPLVAQIVSRLRAAAIDVEVIERALDIPELLSEYARHRMLIGSRMHSCVFARSVGVPFVALGYDAGPKWEVLASFWDADLVLEYGAVPESVAKAAEVVWTNGSALIEASEERWHAGVAGAYGNVASLDAGVRERVVFVVPRLAGGGAEHVVRVVAADMARGSVIDVEIVSLLDEPGVSHRTIDGVEVRALGASRVRRALLPVLRDLRRRPPDAVMSTLRHVSIGLGLLQPLLPRGTRHVARVANTYSAELSTLGRRRQTVHRRVLVATHRRIPSYVCVSKGVRDDLARFGVPAARCTVVPNPVDVDRIHALAAEAGPALAPAVTAAHVRYLAVGRLEPQKDHETLLRAFALACRDVDAALVIVGDGKLRDHLEARAAEFGVADRVQFTGHVANPYPLFRVSDVLVLSSRFEGMPNVLLEGLAFGMRTIATNCPHGPAEILAEPWLGTLVPVGDAACLAAAMAAAATPDHRAADRIEHVRLHHAPAAAVRAYRDALLGGFGTTHG